MDVRALNETARALVAEGKGILAADESTGTIKKRFDSIGVESTEESRRSYRQMLFTAPGAADHISGVILYDETIRQSTDEGTPFPELLASEGISPGIKVDTGAKPLAFSPTETVTEGLDGLRERLVEYRELGARFTKWRSAATRRSARTRASRRSSSPRCSWTATTRSSAATR
jgi:fructose-bisphosphate aldolase, class I